MPGIEGSWVIAVVVISRVFPLFYLTYKSAPEKPKVFDRIVVQITPFPRTKWIVAIGSMSKAQLLIVEGGLGISIAPPQNSPPILELNEDPLNWTFEFIRGE